MNLHVIASGSSGNCLCLENERQNILIDAGVSYLKIKRFLSSIHGQDKDVRIFITHEHSDHIRGLVPLTKAIAPRIYTSEKTAGALIAGGVPEECLYVLDADVWYDFDDFAVKPFRLSHDAAEPFGYRYDIGTQTISVATDLGMASDYIHKSLEGSGTLILESNYEDELLKKSSYPAVLKKRIASYTGHLSNSEALNLAGALSESGLKRCFLAHVSENSNDYELLARYAHVYEECYGVNATVLRQRQQSSFILE